MEELKKMVEAKDWEGLAHYFRTVACKDCPLNPLVYNCCQTPAKTCTELLLEVIA